MSIRIYHVSDLHLHRDPEANVAASRLLYAIHARHFGDPGAYLLLTGDLTDDGDGDQYAQAAVLLHPFRGRLLATPGNHDAGPLGNLYEPAALERFHAVIDALTVSGHDGTCKQPVETELEHGDARAICIGLDSILHTTSPTDFARGELGESQRDALFALLNRARCMDVPTLVYLHHRPLALDWPASPVMRMVDAAEFLEIVDGRVAVVAFGHSGGVTQESERHGNAVTLLADTQFLDANDSVGRGQYFEIAFDGGSSPRVNLLEV